MEFCNTVQRFFKETKNDINYSYGLWQKEIYQEEGRIEGKKEGKKEGEEIGIRNNQIATAKKMLKDNIDVEIIKKYTGLSKKEIHNLIKEKEQES